MFLVLAYCIKRKDIKFRKGKNHTPYLIQIQKQISNPIPKMISKPKARGLSDNTIRYWTSGTLPFLRAPT